MLLFISFWFRPKWQFNFSSAINRLKNCLTSLSRCGECERANLATWRAVKVSATIAKEGSQGRSCGPTLKLFNSETWRSWLARCPLLELRYRASGHEPDDGFSRWLTVRFPKFFTLHTRCTVFPTSPVKFDCMEVSKWGPVPGVGHSSRKSVRKFLRHDAIPPGKQKYVSRHYADLLWRTYFYKWIYQRLLMQEYIYRSIFYITSFGLGSTIRWCCMILLMFDLLFND